MTRQAGVMPDGIFGIASTIDEAFGPFFAAVFWVADVATTFVAEMSNAGHGFRCEFWVNHANYETTAQIADFLDPAAEWYVLFYYGGFQMLYIAELSSANSNAEWRLFKCAVQPTGTASGAVPNDRQF